MRKALNVASLVLTTLLAPVAVSMAQVPRTISYQGYLTASSGTPVPDGSRSITVLIYDREGSATPLFSETHTTAVIKGLFNIIIGSGSQGGIPQSVEFDRQYWIAVSVEGGPELTPRTPLTAAPYAMRAQVAERVVAGSIGPDAIDASAGTTGSILTLGASGAEWRPIDLMAVTSLNGATGAVDIAAGAGLQVNRSGSQITLQSLNLGTVQSIASLSLPLIITDGNGPFTTIALAPAGITGDFIADGAVDTDRLAPDAVTSSRIVDGSIVDADVNPTASIAYTKLNLTNGIVASDLTVGAVTPEKISTTGATARQALTYDGINVIWGNPEAGSLTLPFAQTAGSPSPLFSINNTGPGEAANFTGGATVNNGAMTLTNDIDVASELRLAEPSSGGSHYTALKARSQSTNLSYTMPADAPAAIDQVLKVESVGAQAATLAWGPLTASGLAFTHVSITVANSPFTPTATQDIIGVDVTGGAVEVKLPEANSVSAGKFVIVKNEKGDVTLGSGPDFHNVIVRTSATDLINENQSEMRISWGSAVGVYRFYSDGVSRWYTY